MVCLPFRLRHRLGLCPELVLHRDVISAIELGQYDDGQSGTCPKTGATCDDQRAVTAGAGKGDAKTDAVRNREGKRRVLAGVATIFDGRAGRAANRHSGQALRPLRTGAVSQEKT